MLSNHNLKYICYICRESRYYSNESTKCFRCNNLLSVVFKETVIPRARNLLAWRKLYQNYEKSNEKEAASLFADLHKVLKRTNETESQREEKLRLLLNKLKQESCKKKAFKYLKNWRNNSEIKLIFIDYLKYQPRLCILLIKAGFNITEDILLLALNTDISNKNHIDDYFEVLSIMLNKFNLVSNDKMKKDELVLIGGEKPKRLESLSQHITIMPNLTIIDHKKDTYLHDFINNMIGWLSSRSNFLNNPTTRYANSYDWTLKSISCSAKGFMTTCKAINKFLFTYVDSCTISKIATMRNVKNESAIMLGRIFMEKLKNSIQSIEKIMKFEEFREFKSLLPKIVDLQNVVMELMELFEKSIKQQRKISNRKIKRRIEIKSINLEETVEDLKECF
ncbi:hypothetical protein RclHR1_03820012 [Rhizophagus clarus]|uniref:Uncharacterized protein n=1 Tax=Rhizophagus clarus TaxID=94130 RepID=A0A2Z6S7M1_9GLOM|nr:hypothetical protein RclHR1_03820012 [Rhizophagus clarus]GET01628.1 hypothetical protein GLOIN_2v1775419 [Rhizophagus clarus]